VKKSGAINISRNHFRGNRQVKRMGS